MRIFLTTLVMLLVPAGLAPGQTTQPTEGGDESILPVDDADLPPVDALDAMRRGLALSDREKQILVNVRDGLRSPGGAGFYYMMRKVAALPKLDEDQQRQVDRVAFGNLLRDPGRYRFLPIRLRIDVRQVMEMTVANKLISASPYWPEDRPIFEVHGLLVDDGQERKNEPIIIYSPVRPPGLPEPMRVLADGREQFRPGQIYDVVGVFYNLLQRQTVGDQQVESHQRPFPAVLAWQFEMPRARQLQANTADWYTALGVIGALVLGVALFIVLKSKIAKNKSAQPVMSRYRPLRVETVGQSGDDEEPADGPVDPALAAAARAYRKEHGLDDDPSAKGD